MLGLLLFGAIGAMPEPCFSRLLRARMLRGRGVLPQRLTETFGPDSLIRMSFLRVALNLNTEEIYTAQLHVIDANISAPTGGGETGECQQANGTFFGPRNAKR